MSRPRLVVFCFCFVSEATLHTARWTSVHQAVYGTVLYCTVSFLMHGAMEPKPHAGLLHTCLPAQGRACRVAMRGGRERLCFQVLPERTGRFLFLLAFALLGFPGFCLFLLPTWSLPSCFPMMPSLPCSSCFCVCFHFHFFIHVVVWHLPFAGVRPCSNRATRTIRRRLVVLFFLFNLQDRALGASQAGASRVRLVPRLRRR